MLAIYRLLKSEGIVTNKLITEYLVISKASVTEMLKKLKNENLIYIEKNKISLSNEGLKIAEDLISTHRLWEYFLVEILNLDEDFVHYQADLLEHVTTDKLKEALNKYLNYPTESPKGNKIFQEDD